jgi:predicted HicB family RNase H-like nuclease
MRDRVRTGLRIPYELNTWLTLKAAEQGISKNSYILLLLWNRKHTEDKK